LLRLRGRRTKDSVMFRRGPSCGRPGSKTGAQRVLRVAAPAQVVGTPEVGRFCSTHRKHRTALWNWASPLLRTQSDRLSDFRRRSKTKFRLSLQTARAIAVRVAHTKVAS